jgi:hypothetical protein
LVLWIALRLEQITVYRAYPPNAGVAQMTMNTVNNGAAMVTATIAAAAKWLDIFLSN